MRQEKIPVYDICSLTSGQCKEKDFLAERFKDYLGRHSPALHLPHRHDFYHLVFFTQGWQQTYDRLYPVPRTADGDMIRLLLLELFLTVEKTAPRQHLQKNNW